ncbi:hypothetical protein [Ruminococcus flavefaciens]|uniref:hypothetical protein n=1 Tax=Ruminococcus flavefaciens TaxID=1265 RepID=UPI0026EA7EA8|nr:hypothetical protein [Ruminococcus flavefaciens]
MKKIAIMHLVLLCLCALFGCSSYNSGEIQTPKSNSDSIQIDNNELNHQSNENENILAMKKDEKSFPKSSSSVTIQTPPDYYSYLFESYNELSSTLIKRDSIMLADLNDYGELFNRTVSAFENGIIDLYVPVIDGNVCDLRNKDGFSNISMMTAELYNLPWIWYHCKVSDSDLEIKLAYPSIIENDELNSAKTYCEALKIIAPDAPNPDNYPKYESYQNIYESEILLANDTTVIAMISEIKNSSKVYVMFNYDGMLVSIYADNEILSETFWHSFALAKY